MAGTILREIDKGGYAAVAAGLHGEKLGLAKNLNLASVVLTIVLSAG